jgi:hypothetical protein
MHRTKLSAIIMRTKMLELQGNSLCRRVKGLYICEIHADIREVSRMASSADVFLFP